MSSSGERHDDDQDVQRPAAQVLGREQLGDEPELPVEPDGVEPPGQDPQRLLDDPCAPDGIEPHRDVRGVREAALGDRRDREADGGCDQYRARSADAEEERREQRSRRLRRCLDDTDHDAAGRELGRLVYEQRQKASAGRVRHGRTDREQRGEREQRLAWRPRLAEHGCDGCDRRPREVDGQREPLAAPALGHGHEHRGQNGGREQSARPRGGPPRSLPPTCRRSRRRRPRRWPRPRNRRPMRRGSPSSGAVSSGRAWRRDVPNRGRRRRSFDDSTAARVSFGGPAGDVLVSIR